MILSIDPGKKHIGWALFTVSGAFCDAGLARGASLEEQMSQMPERDIITRVVGEVMTHYPTARARDAKANDLLDLQFRMGYIAGCYHATFYGYRTAEWKGQLPKEVCKQRILRRLAGSDEELLTHLLTLVPPSLRHNVYDAVGIGLHHLKRGVLCG
jgi:hypothetical protein